MLSCETPPTAVTLSQRTQYANAWVVTWQATLCRALLAAIQANHLTIYSATGGDWIASVSWGSERVIVTQAQDKGPPHRFNGAKSAFVFLDAVLMHYLAVVDIPTQSTEPQFLPTAGAL